MTEADGHSGSQRDSDAPPPGARAGGRAKARAVLHWLRPFVVAVLLFAVLRLFVVQVYGIGSGSMDGTLRVGDYVIANNTLFGARIPFTSLHTPALRPPRRGDVVVYRPVYNDPRVDVVKRVIGVPGDTIQMRDRVVIRNGRPLDEPYVDLDHAADRPMPDEGPNNYQWHRDALADTSAFASYRPTRDSWGPLVVPPGHFLLLGDNRDESIDSRYMGFVPRREIRGKVLLIHYSRSPGRDRPFPRVLTAARWDRMGKIVR